MNRIYIRYFVWLVCLFQAIPISAQIKNASTITTFRQPSQHLQYPFFQKIQGFVDVGLPEALRLQALESLSPEKLKHVRAIFQRNSIEPWFEFLPPREIKGLRVPSQMRLDDYGYAHRESREHFKHLFMRLAEEAPDRETLPIVVFQSDLEGLAALAATRGFVRDVSIWTGESLLDRPAVLAAHPDQATTSYKVAHEIGHLLGLEHHANPYNLMSASSLATRLNQRQARHIRAWLNFYQKLRKPGSTETLANVEASKKVADLGGTPPAIEPNPWAQDFYERVGATKEMTTAQLKSAYRRAVMQYHTDRHEPKDKAAFEKMTKATQNILEAYATLGDVSKKARYDHRPAGFSAVQVRRAGPGRRSVQRVKFNGRSFPSRIQSTYAPHIERIRAIDAAQKSVRIILDRSTSPNVLDTLSRAQKRGVKIYIKFMSSRGPWKYPELDRKMLIKLREAGFKVYTFDVAGLPKGAHAYPNLFAIFDAGMTEVTFDSRARGRLWTQDFDTDPDKLDSFQKLWRRFPRAL